MSIDTLFNRTLCRKSKILKEGTITLTNNIQELHMQVKSNIVGPM